MELMQLTIFDELETQVVEKLVVGDRVKVRQEAIDRAEKSRNVESYHYLQEYRHSVGEILKKDYGKNGACFEVAYKGKRNAIFNSDELVKI